MQARRTFTPLVLLGLASSAVAAVAGSRRMMLVSDDALVDRGVPATTLERIQGGGNADAIAGTSTVAGDLPLAGALALVLLALWGVLLVTRGNPRVVVAWLTVLAAAGTLAAFALGFGNAADGYGTAVWDVVGRPGGQPPGLEADATGWFWAGCVAAVLALVVAVASTLFVRHWPAMGSRYDAPGAQSGQPTVDPSSASSTDLWKSIDEGHDPTA